MGSICRVPSTVARRSLHDRYFKQAKQEGYVARSAYKLIEIQDRHRLFKRGQRVLDLGCAPGSWLQVVMPIVCSEGPSTSGSGSGPGGSVIGIDLTRVRVRFEHGVRTIEGDAFEQDPAELIELAGGKFDAVISDMAPNTTGSGDDLISARLCRQVLELAPLVGRSGSCLVMKILEGSEYPQVLDETKQIYSRVKGFRPKATRDVSREIFIIAQGLRKPKSGDDR